MKVTLTVLNNATHVTRIIFMNFYWQILLFIVELSACIMFVAKWIENEMSYHAPADVPAIRLTCGTCYGVMVLNRGDGTK